MNARLTAAGLAAVLALLAVPFVAAADADADSGASDLDNQVWAVSGSTLIRGGSATFYSGTVTWVIFAEGTVTYTGGTTSTYAVDGAAQVTITYELGTTSTVTWLLPNGTSALFVLTFYKTVPAPTPTPEPDVSFSWSQLSEHDQQLVEAVIAACLLPSLCIIPFWMVRKSESWEDVI